MLTKPSVPRPVPILWVIAVLTSVIGAAYLPAVSPVSSLVAACVLGQTVDSATGTCPDQPTDVAATPPAANPAVVDAEQSNGQLTDVAPGPPNAEQSNTADEALALVRSQLVIYHLVSFRVISHGEYPYGAQIP